MLAIHHQVSFWVSESFLLYQFLLSPNESIIVLLVLVVFVILAKRYKYHVRENEVNIHQIVDDHYQKYMEQEEEYDREREQLFC